ncbi:MAG: hypothetical protein GEV07_14645 [Streptosporangiales bacterium]|nr:hypothetical protein [Streptosporangiales bacterium]
MIRAKRLGLERLERAAVAGDELDPHRLADIRMAGNSSMSDLLASCSASAIAICTAAIPSAAARGDIPPDVRDAEAVGGETRTS